MYKHFIVMFTTVLFSVILGCMVGGWQGGLLWGNLVLLLWLLRHLFQLFRLHKWLQNPKISNIPKSNGIWGEIFETLLRQTKSRKKSKQKLANALTRLNRIAEAMPNGVILLDKLGKLEWLNQSAAQHLQLNPHTDRDSVFKDLIELSELNQFLEDLDDKQPEKTFFVAQSPNFNF